MLKNMYTVSDEQHNEYQGLFRKLLMEVMGDE